MGRAPSLVRVASWGSAALAVMQALAVAAWPEAATASPASIERGRRLALAHCQACHAIAGRRPSPLAQAPPFPELQQRHPEQGLEETFADGVRSNHPPMPSFLASPDELQDLLDYIRSIQRVTRPAL